MKSDSPVKRRNDTKCFERQRIHICLEGYIGSLNKTYCFSLFTSVTTKRRPDWLRYQCETDQGTAWEKNSHLPLYTWDYLFANDVVFGQFSRAHEGRRQGKVVKDPVTALECAATTKPSKNVNRGLYTSFLDDCGLYTRGRSARLRVGGSVARFIKGSAWTCCFRFYTDHLFSFHSLELFLCFVPFVFPTL